MRLRITITALKIVVAALAVGTILSSLNVTVEQVLTDFGLTPEEVFGWLDAQVHWALPNLILGLIIILPVWIVIYLFSSPKG